MFSRNSTELRHDFSSSYRFGSSISVLDLVHLGSGLSLRNFVRLSSTCSALSLARFGSSPSTTQSTPAAETDGGKAHGGEMSYILVCELRGGRGNGRFACLRSFEVANPRLYWTSWSTCRAHCVGASVLDFVHLGSSLSVRAFARLGSSLAFHGAARFGDELLGGYLSVPTASPGSVVF